MLSIASVANSAKAGHYFESDNYYSKDDPQAKTLSGWYGKGAALLGLSGEVGREQFVALLDGKMPDGTRLGIVKDGAHHHRQGYDLTFSAPKSVSLLLELGGDTRLLAAHDKAVNQALSQIESELASARITERGETRIEKTGNLAIAKFIHDSSRALDPQLHTHAIVLNATVREDGKIRALASQSPFQTNVQGKSGFMEQLFESKLYYGSLYRAHLAYEVTQLGYTVSKTHSDGRFEIAGVDNAAITHFSKRREDIEAAMQAQGLAGGKQAAYATLLTRANKQDMSHDALQAHWQAQAKDIGFDASSVVLAAKETPIMRQGKEAAAVSTETAKLESSLPVSPSPPMTPAPSNFFENLIEQLKVKFQHVLNPAKFSNTTLSLSSSMTQEEKAHEAVAYAMAHLSERDSAFTLHQLKAIAFTHQLGDVSPSDVEQSIEAAIEKKVLLPGYTSQGQQLYTTPVAKALEQDTLSRMVAMQQQVAPLVNAKHAQLALSEYGLNAEQYQAALMVLTTRDGVVGIQGFAGTGKTSSLKATQQVAREEITQSLSVIKRLLQTDGVDMVGLAPSAAAANQLAQSAQIPSQTLSRFLLMQHHQPTFSNKPALWVLDEASMVSTRQMNELIKLAGQQGAHLVLVGDTMQLLAVEAGKPFAQLQQHGMKTAHLTEIKRQTNPALLQSVHASIQGDVKRALGNIAGNIIEVPDKAERLTQLAESWLALSPERRAQTLVITPVNQDREEVNALIRNGLQQEGVVSQIERTSHILVNRGLTGIEKTRVANYQEGDMLRFGTAQKSIRKGSYWEVSHLDKKSNTLTLNNEKGQSIQFALDSLKTGEQTIEIYEKKMRLLGAGDSIRWTRNDTKKHVANSELATVTKVTQHHAHIQTAQGDKLKMDLRMPSNQHWEHAYASTVYAAQGQTRQHVIAHEESYRKLTTQRAFYVILSRAKESVTLFVDNKAAYLTQLNTLTGDKHSALEVKNQAGFSSILPSSMSNSPPEKLAGVLSQESTDSQAFPSSQSNDKASHDKSQTVYFDKEQVREKLHHQLEHIVEKLLGQPNQKLSNSREWRYGKKGAMVVSMTGIHQGKWHSFEGSAGKVGGDIFSLIEREMMVNFNGAVKIAAQWIGAAASTVPLDKAAPKLTNTSSKLIPTAEDITQMEKARFLYSKSKPIEGTLAEKYLKNHRGIELDKLSSSLRFLPATGPKQHASLLIKAENPQGQIEAVQLIYLDKKTAAKANIDVQKRQFGRMKFGAYGVVQEGSNHKIFIAEGVETALSIAQAYPDAKVITTLSGGNIKNVVLPKETKEIVLCADNDKSKAHALEALSPAIKRFEEQGKVIYFAFPQLQEKERGQSIKHDTNQIANSNDKPSKIDFNDVHKTEGIESVKKQLAEAERLTISIENIFKIDNKNSVEKDKSLTEFEKIFISTQIAHSADNVSHAPEKFASNSIENKVPATQKIQEEKTIIKIINHL